MGKTCETCKWFRVGGVMGICRKSDVEIEPNWAEICKDYRKSRKLLYLLLLLGCCRVLPGAGAGCGNLPELFELAEGGRSMTEFSIERDSPDDWTLKIECQHSTHLIYLDSREVKRLLKILEGARD